MEKELLLKIKSVFASEWNLPIEKIPDDAALNQFDHWDSLGHITILLALQSSLGLDINPDTVQNLSSIPKILAYCQQKGIE